MSFTLLPLELLYHIYSFLSNDSNSLSSLSLVNSNSSIVAQHVLYQRLNLVNNYPLKTLAINSKLASKVKSFSLSLSSDHSPALLHNALANMLHLVELDIFIHPTTSSFLRNNSYYPFLTRFATSLPWNSDLVHFLHKSPTISQLYLDSQPTESPFPPLPPAFLPDLSHFTGPPSLALLLIPHRPVQHIDLTSSNGPGLTPNLALSLSRSSAPVLTLAATTSSTRQNEDEDLLSVLNVLHTCMPHLRHLRVVTNTYTDSFAFPGVFNHSYFENITQALGSLPDLQSCEIWGFHWVSSKNSIKRSSWHSPSFNSTSHSNALDDFLIFPY